MVSPGTGSLGHVTDGVKSDASFDRTIVVRGYRRSLSKKSVKAGSDESGPAYDKVT